MARFDADICVIGAGSGGLTVAAGAAMLGLSTVLVEKGAMGGDCLNTGCVPSKALIAAARHAQALRAGAFFGVRAGASVDFAAAMAHVRSAIETIAEHDSVARFESLGVRVIRGEGAFLDRHTLRAGTKSIRARRFVIATGSRPRLPPIPGLADVPFLTNETVFENKACPEHLIVIGGGAIGLELAQAHRRLGAQVSVLEQAHLLGKDDPDLVGRLRYRLAAEGLTIHEGVTVTAIARRGPGVEVHMAAGGKSKVLVGSHLLVAVGRAPVLEGLQLDRAGVRYAHAGIAVDRCQRTSNRRIYAVGDVTGGPQFTHAASYQAGLVLRHAVFRLPAWGRRSVIPSVTYTDPELAQVGLTATAAEALYPGRVRVICEDLSHNDRAVTERCEGLLKLVVRRDGRILGAGLLAPQAGDLILPWELAVSGKLTLRTLATMVVPYPTLSEVTKRAASAYYRETVAGGTLRRLVHLLKWLP